ncbi:MAG: penicillin-binding transpeptidase domain-containing protein [Gammaproteobacteria bacterium]|nr:penicillin-binding transpeptidase domain-containing protein [Gammaproteobacteria bacterium]
MKRRGDAALRIWRNRSRLLLAVFALIGCGLGARAFELQVLQHDFLLGQGQERQQRVVNVPAHRGMVLDRHGAPLAVSTPVDSVWADPRELLANKDAWPHLAKALSVARAELAARLAEASEREFVYLQRQVTPSEGARIAKLEIAGVHLQREYRRYYPSGEVLGHLLGFTDIDDRGQEGLELAFDAWLVGNPGQEHIVQDRRGQMIKRLQSVRVAQPGRDLTLSVDKRLQYLAYRELKAAVQRHGALSGSVIVLDVHSGEVLAMVNQPGFNPNDRGGFRKAALRNRAVTDVFEPGSTMKTFTVAAALEQGRVTPLTSIDTAPGRLRVGQHTVRDRHNLGVLSVSDILRKSSNVGASRLALAVTPEALWSIFSRAGFGQSSGSAFPGEASGSLAEHSRWREIEQATMGFGYGLSVTALQLVRAYAAIAAGGVLPEITFQKRTEPVEGERILSQRLAAALTQMLEGVTLEGGTGQRAAIPGYRVAGKTGTSKKSTAGGYSDDRYMALFVGFAPATAPRLAAVVVINEPGGEVYYGGQVAAPVFSKVIAGALRLLDVMPDDPRVFQASAGTVGDAS